MSQSSPSGWAATSEPLLVAPIRAPILSPRAPLDCAAASPEPAHLTCLTPSRATMPLDGRLGEIERALVLHEEAAAEHARGAAACVFTQVACRAKVGFAIYELQLLSKDGTHSGSKFAARCKELFGEKFEDNEAWLSKCASHVGGRYGGMKRFCEFLEDTDIKIGCGYKSIQNAINYFHTLLDAFAEKSPVASQYLASDVRVCYYDYKMPGFVEDFASCMADTFDFTKLTELVKYCEEQQKAAALVTLSDQAGCPVSALDGWDAKVLGHPQTYWFRDPSGNEYVSLEAAAEAAASLLSESETESSSNKRSRPDDDADDAPSSKRLRGGGYDKHSTLVRVCKRAGITHTDQMDTAELEQKIRFWVAAHNPPSVPLSKMAARMAGAGSIVALALQAVVYYS